MAASEKHCFYVSLRGFTTAVKNCVCQVPTDLCGLANLLAKIKKRLADGNRVLIHCFGGMGRAVLVGCCLHMDLDEDIEPGDVIEQVYTTIAFWVCDKCRY